MQRAPTDWRADGAPLAPAVEQSARSATTQIVPVGGAGRQIVSESGEIGR